MIKPNSFLEDMKIDPQCFCFISLIFSNMLVLGASLIWRTFYYRRKGKVLGDFTEIAGIASIFRLSCRIRNTHGIPPLLFRAERNNIQYRSIHCMLFSLSMECGPALINDGHYVIEIWTKAICFFAQPTFWFVGTLVLSVRWESAYKFRIHR